MLETKHAFDRLQISPSCVTRAVQMTSQMIAESASPIKKAQDVIVTMLTVAPPTFKDAKVARMTAARVAEMLVRAEHRCEDPDKLLAEATEHATKLHDDPRNEWMWAEPEAVAGVATTSQTVVEGLDTKVEIKSDGSIKKGGKQILVAEMYKKNVLEAATPMTNQQFIALVVKELKMSKAGATTYAYNAKKELGEPAGGIVKAKKGRKAKEAS
jgi:hypothetical protein